MNGPNKRILCLWIFGLQFARNLSTLYHFQGELSKRLVNNGSLILFGLPSISLPRFDFYNGKLLWLKIFGTSIRWELSLLADNLADWYRNLLPIAAIAWKVESSPVWHSSHSGNHFLAGATKDLRLIRSSSFARSRQSAFDKSHINSNISGPRMSGS